MTTSFKPFENDSQAMVVAGDLNIENGQDVIVLSGAVEISRDKVGLERAKALQVVLGEIVGRLEADRNLPEKLVPAQNTPAYVKSPF